MLSFNMGFGLKSNARSSVMPPVSDSSFRRTVPVQEDDGAAQVPAETPEPASTPDEVGSGMDDATLEALGQLRAQQQAEAAARVAPTRSKASGGRRYLKTLRAEREAQDARAQTAGLFGELPGSDAGLDDEEMASARVARRADATQGLAAAQDVARWRGLAGAGAALSGDEAEDLKAEQRRDAIVGWQQASRAAPARPPAGAPSLEGIDEGELGVGLRSAFRNERSPQGILREAGAASRGGVRWRDEHPQDGAFAERTKHFEFLDPADTVAGEQEFGAAGFSVPDDTRTHPDYVTNKAQMDDRKVGNRLGRSGELRMMALGMDRREANANTYAQDLGDTSQLLSYPKQELAPAEEKEFAGQARQARRMQNRALGMHGYSEGDTGRIARRANASRAGGKPGFFATLVDALGLGKLFGAARTDDRTFDAVPRRRERTPPGNWFQRLFGTSRRAAR